MNKRKLQKLRVLTATPKMMRVALADTPRLVKRYYDEQEVYEYGLYMRAWVIDDILKVAFFLPEHMRSGGRNAAYELLVSHASRQFITYDHLHEKWLTAKLDMLQWPRYSVNSEKKWISKTDYAVIQKYLATDEGGYSGLLKYQRQIREEELKQRHKRETDPWDADLEQIPKLPKDWKRWVSKVGITQNYIFYQYKRHGAETGYCTYCEKEVPIKRPRHNAEGRCPCCRHLITFKSVGKAGTVQTGRQFMYLLQRCRDGFVIREFQGDRKYHKCEYRSPTCSSWEIRRVIYPRNGEKPRAYYWGDYKQSGIRWIRGSLCGPSWWEDQSGKVYGKTLPSLAKREKLGHTGLIERLRDKGAIDPEGYLVVLREVPQLEQIAKAGLSRLVDECLAGYYSFLDQLHAPKANSLTGMLGIDTQELKRLRNSNGGSLFLDWLKHEKATGRLIPDEVISWFCAEKIKAEDLKFIRDRMSVVQVRNYVRRQMSENKMSSKEVLITWSDYLSMAKRLKMDTDDEIIFRVRKLRQRHDELVSRCQKEFAILACEIIEKYPHVDDICQSLKEKYEYSGKDYAVVAPSCIEDIMLEGRNLSHCVAESDRYWDRIERQETYVLFLRRASAIDKPYYTLEVEPDGTVRQKRTKFDRQEADIDDAKKFLAEWQKVVTKRITVSDRKLAEKSRILRNQEYAQLRSDHVIIHTGALAGNLLVDVLLADLMETDEVKPATAERAAAA
ncbi:PcfJ domain-containing protein [Caproicibacter sp. BJN0012]|uniref:PcfJ domain-containing protein n=1 Tax=Caproicibacter sp. BJN0012 TaxID=3110227 RepID=UPI002E0F9DCB